MNKKHEAAITPAELTRLTRLIAAETATQNKKNRADIAHASAQQDRLECMQDLAMRYRLKEKDLIDPKTGTITRA